VLGEIDDYHASWLRSTGGARTQKWVGSVRKRLVAGAIQGSTQIEGYTVELDTVAAMVTGTAPPAAVPEESTRAVLGYRDALTWVLTASELPFFAYGETMLSTLHFMMTRGLAGHEAGRYRKRRVMVSGSDPLRPVYTAPDPEDVPGLMREFVDWLNLDEPQVPVLVKAAMAHLNLVSIRPWRDGNGRMSRCVQTLVIAPAGRVTPEFCSIEAWLGYELNTMEYFHVLRQTRDHYDPDQGTHAWVRFCLRAHHLQAQVVDSRLRYGQEIWMAMEQLAERHGFDHRSVAALNAAATGQLTSTRRDCPGTRRSGTSAGWNGPAWSSRSATAPPCTTRQLATRPSAPLTSWRRSPLPPPSPIPGRPDRPSSRYRLASTAESL